MVVAGLLAACTPGMQERNADNGVPPAEGALPPAEPGAGAPPELGASLNVGVQGDSTHIEIHVTNVAGRMLTLEFATTQRYDVEISDSSGRRVWRWSDDMMFAQVLGREVVLAGESMRYVITWPRPVPGEYVATARIVSTNYPVELRTSFRIPAD
jgi:hypothetical protein